MSDVCVLMFDVVRLACCFRYDMVCPVVVILSFNYCLSINGDGKVLFVAHHAVFDIGRSLVLTELDNELFRQCVPFAMGFRWLLPKSFAVWTDFGYEDDVVDVFLLAPCFRKKELVSHVDSVAHDAVDAAAAHHRCTFVACYITFAKRGDLCLCDLV